MRKDYLIGLLMVAMTLPAGAKTFKGTTTLKDVQTAGSPDKDHKHQMYDLLFTSADKSYTCRTDGKHSMNATDFVVGSEMKYEVDGKDGKLKNTDGKEVKCRIVRVEMLSTRP